jgi:hypothetical protein
VNTRMMFVSHVRSTKPIQRRQCALDSPARATQPAAVWPPAFRQWPGDSPPPELIAVRLRLVPTVTLHEPGFRKGGPGRPRSGGMESTKANKLRHVVPVRRREARDNRNPVGVSKRMMFRPGLASDCPRSACHSSANSET